MNEEHSLSSTIDFPLKQFSFLFPNRFKITGKKWFFKTSIYYGLCGGMCFTALDAYYRQVNLPAITHPEKIPKQLYYYLLSRQLSSTGIWSLLKLIFWLFKNDQYLFTQTMQIEVPKLMEEIKYGKPVPIVVVRSKFLQNPTNNHQILVLGYQKDPDRIRLKCYDPNYPGCYTELFLENSINPEKIQFIHSSGEIDRGFFINDYKPKSPEKIFHK